MARSVPLRGSFDSRPIFAGQRIAFLRSATRHPEIAGSPSAAAPAVDYFPKLGSADSSGRISIPIESGQAALAFHPSPNSTAASIAPPIPDSAFYPKTAFWLSVCGDASRNRCRYALSYLAVWAEFGFLEGFANACYHEGSAPRQLRSRISRSRLERVTESERQSRRRFGMTRSVPRARAAPLRRTL